MDAVFSAPGRVNLIGEHTDYNDGFVMPVALDRHTHVRVTMRNDRRLSVVSSNLQETAEASLDALTPRRHWSDYVFGVAAALQSSGVRLRGADLSISSDVPLGAGLSSSASLEVATAQALLAVAGASMDSVALARLCQRAENEFVGARVGIMDQFVALHGRPGYALLLDCRSLEYRLAALPARVKIVVVNSMVKHELAGSEYNKRREDCEGAVRALSSVLPGITALRDVTLAQLQQHGGVLSPRQLKRARHVVTENERVTVAADALAHGDAEAVGGMFAASHHSMRDDYEISCDEIDALIDIASAAPGARGSRMTGGGFGGCIVSLVDASDMEAFVEAVRAGYERRIGKRPEFYV